MLLVVSAVLGTAFKGEFTADYNSPGTGSAGAAELLAERFEGQSGDAVDIVWKSEQGATSAAASEEIDALLAEVGKVEGIVPGASVQSAEVAEDGRTAIARVPLDRPAGAIEAASGERIAELIDQTRGEGLEVAADSTIAGLVPEAGMSA